MRVEVFIMVEQSVKELIHKSFQLGHCLGKQGLEYENAKKQLQDIIDAAEKFECE
jgi:hypothetical protein